MSPRHFLRTRRTVLFGLVLGSLTLLSVLGWNRYHRNRADQALLQRQFDLAFEELSWCWRTPEVRFLRGQTARRAGRLAEAEVILEECRRSEIMTDKIDLERGLLGIQKGQQLAAVRFFHEQAEAGHPDAILIYEAVAPLLLKSYRIPDAVRAADHWLSLEPEAVPALIVRGEAHEKLRQRLKAIEDYGRAWALDPERVELLAKMGSLHLELNQPREALARFETLSQRRPEEMEASLGRVRCLREMGELEKARAVLGPLQEKLPEDPRIQGERGQIALQAGNAEDAEPWLRKAVTASPGDRMAVYRYSACLEQLGRHEEAKAWKAKLEVIEADLQQMHALTQRIATDPGNAQLRHEAGALMIRNGEDMAGIRWLNSALEQDPNHEPTHRLLAEVYTRLGKPEEAARHRARGKRP